MLLDRFKKNIQKNNLIKQGDRIVVGVSGGADSICLLMCLYAIKEEMDLKLAVAHVNHGIRGAQADEDEAFVREFCEERGIDFYVEHADVKAIAEYRKVSEEEAGRDIRYEFFDKVGAKLCGSSLEDIDDETLERFQGEELFRIAVAHNKNDQAETILFNLLRGCSINGLSGMRLERNKIIRPLIYETREEIEKFLGEQGQTYRIDSTNLDCNYTRNIIRNKLIPFIESKINSKATDHLISLGEEAELASDYIKNEAEKFTGIREGVDDIYISIEKLNSLHECVKDRVVYDAICKMAGRVKDISKVHVESVLGLMNSHNGARLNLPCEVTAEKIDGEIGLFSYITHVPLEIIEPDIQVLDLLNGELKNARIFDYDGHEKFPENKYLKWFDYDKIVGSATWRYRESGDIFATSDTARKPLRKHMTDEKLLPRYRDVIPVLADGSDIIWIYGGRISADYKLTSETKRVIEVSVPEGLDKPWEKQKN